MQIRDWGLNSKVTQIAYDPVQSLIAVGTSESKFGNGQIYVFGQHRVEVVFPLLRQASVKILQFCAEKRRLEERSVYLLARNEEACECALPTGKDHSPAQ
jgi:hypothetical protein